MTYPPGPVLWVSGQRLDAADLNDWMQHLPWGLVTSAEITANSSAFTTLADVASLSVTFTALADRLYRLEADVHPSSTVAADRIQVQITDGSNVVQALRYTTISSNAHSEGLAFSTVVEPGAGSVTYKIRAERTSGSGTAILFATGTGNANAIRVFDVGSAP